MASGVANVVLRVVTALSREANTGLHEVKSSLDVADVVSDVARGVWALVGGMSMADYFVAYVILRSDTGDVSDSLAGLGVDG